MGLWEYGTDCITINLCKESIKSGTNDGSRIQRTYAISLLEERDSSFRRSMTLGIRSWAEVPLIKMGQSESSDTRLMYANVMDFAIKNSTSRQDEYNKCWTLPSNAVKNIIEEVDNSWGIYSEVEEKISNCFKIKMNGSPWGPGGKGEKATKIRRLLLKIFAIMKSSQYRYVTNINMKGTTDNLFFRFDPTLVPDNNLAFVLYLSKKNRLRFIDGPENVTTQIKNTINQFWSGGVTCERIYNDALEFKISGCPWSAHSYAAANSRMLTSIILKEIRNLGYQTIATLDISRRSDDKSIFVFGGGSGFQISPDLNIKWTCLYFCGRNKLMLVGVHEDVVSILQDCLKPLKEDNGKKRRGHLSLEVYYHEEIYVVSLFDLESGSENTGRANFKPSKTAIISSSYFEAHCYRTPRTERPRPKDDAIPSIFNGIQELLQKRNLAKEFTMYCTKKKV
ncbi:unnamed protein product [Lepeophtheirus salmonis]|uniref:(salmon louse) hypothetical protein n=1 Tax=Lepeophtheirus salmonis TaxID=72036 RepID=A0A7R8CRL8_LEPSM|nr:unnamed protein product [Lepeophtheirus salmonis]CAF2871791.1 unnamed protein product [Lepeophtheirus salmonis]